MKRDLREAINAYLVSPNGDDAKLLKDLIIRLDEAKRDGERMTKSAGRKSVYPWAEWTDGQVHVAVEGKNFWSGIPGFLSALYTHARTRRLRLRTCRSDDEIKFQFLPEGSTEDFAFRKQTGYKRVDHAERRGIIEAFIAGKLTPDEARKRLGGVSRQRLYQLVNASGAELDTDRYSPFHILSEADVEAYRNNKATVQAMAKKMGVNKSSASAILQHHGVKRRKRIQTGRNVQRTFRLSEEDIKRYLNDQETVDSLAAKLKCSRTTITNLLADAQVHKAPQHMRNRFVLSEQERADLASRRVGVSEITRKHGVMFSTVRKAMVRQNVVVEPLLEELPA